MPSRRYDQVERIEALEARLPSEFAGRGLGEAELDLIDFVFNYRTNRVLLLSGSRGVGKTSLLHFIEQTLAVALPAKPFLFLNVNCLALNESFGIQDICGLLADEIEAQLAIADAAFRPALTEALNELARGSGPTQVRRATKQLVEASPDQDPKRVLVVIDNIDQAQAASVDIAVSLAREIHTGTGLGVIVSLRPGSHRRIQARGSAGAFFSVIIPVHPPAIQGYLDHLETRLEYAARELEMEGNRRPIWQGEPLSPERIGRSISRLARLFQDRLPTDDPSGLLSAVSANNTRHLALLLRRTFAHRSLPDAYLLGFTQDPGTEFHPITSMMENGRSLFVSSTEIPNILYSEAPDGNVEYIIQHRTLQLLDARMRPTRDLLKWLAAYGYSDSAARDAIRRLQESALIGYSDVDVLHNGERLPDSCYLTEAGEYYRNRIMSLGDYLIAAVTDVPLAHEHILRIRPTYLQSDQAFPARIESLLEYFELVRSIEARQIAALKRLEPSSSTRRAADALGRGGLLSDAVARGLQDLIDRSLHSVSSRSRKAAIDAANQMEKAAAQLRSLHTQLDDARNRGNKYREEMFPDLGELVLPDGHFRLTGQRAGDDIHVTGEGRLQGLDLAAVLACGRAKSGITECDIAIARIDPPGDRGEGLLRANFRDISPNRLENEERLTPYLLGLNERDGRVGFLFTNVDGDRLSLELINPNDGGDARLLSRPNCNLFELQSKAKEIEEFISGYSMDPELDLTELSEVLFVAGMELSNSVLSEAGRNQLSSQVGLLDTLVILGVEPEIPWEWLTLPSDGLGEPAMIGDLWRTIRWPDTMDGAFKAALFKIVPQSTATRALLTIGESLEVQVGEELVIPRNSTMPRISAGYDSLHLIGHLETASGTDIVRVSPNYPLTASAAETYRADFSNVVLSSCSSGTRPLSSSLPAAVAKQWRCVTWSPMVKIARSLAERLDQHLHDFLEDAEAPHLDDFFGDRGRSQGIARLYCRYGIAAESLASGGSEWKKR